MSVLVVKVPSYILNEAAINPNSYESCMIESITKGMEEYLEGRQLGIILPNDDSYLVEVEGDGEIKEFRIECSDKINGE